MRTLRSFLKDEAGATAIEYGLIAALMAAVVIGGISLIDDGLTGAFTDIQTTLDGAIEGGGDEGGGEG